MIWFYYCPDAECPVVVFNSKTHDGCPECHVPGLSINSLRFRAGDLNLEIAVVSKS